MAYFHFRIKSDKSKGKNAIRTAAMQHAEYIDREGRFKDADKLEVQETNYMDVISGEKPIADLPEEEILLYESSWGNIVLDKEGVRLSRGASNETTAIALEVARKIYGDNLRLSGKAEFKQRTLEVQSNLGMEFTWENPALAKLAQSLKEEKENDRRNFEQHGGKYIKYKKPDLRRWQRNGRGPVSAEEFFKSHIERRTEGAAAGAGRSLRALSQRPVGRVREDAAGGVSGEELSDFRQRARRYASHVRWDVSRARRRVIAETADRILAGLVHPNREGELDHVFAASHVQYINREAAFKKRGGCVYKAHHLPKWAKDSPRIFFENADRFERGNGERYKEIEIALPNELPMQEQIKIIDTFIDHHLKNFYYAYAIHDKVGSMSNGERHPHVHIMFSTRELDEVERRQERSPEMFFHRANPKEPAKGGCRKADKWRDKYRGRYTVEMRADFAQIQNGVNVTVDHRSLKLQREEALAHGNKLLADLLDRIPESSVGPNA